MRSRRSIWHSRIIRQRDAPNPPVEHDEFRRFRLAQDNCLRGLLGTEETEGCVGGSVSLIDRLQREEKGRTDCLLSLVFLVRYRTGLDGLGLWRVLSLLPLVRWSFRDIGGL